MPSVSKVSCMPYNLIQYSNFPLTPKCMKVVAGGKFFSLISDFTNFFNISFEGLLKENALLKEKV